MPAITAGLKALRGLFNKTGRKEMKHISPFREHKGKANKEVKDKRERASKKDYEDRMEKEPRKMRMERASKELGSNDQPLSEGKGLNAASPDKAGLKDREGNISRHKMMRAEAKYKSLKKSLLMYDKHEASDKPRRQEIMSKLYSLEEKYGFE